MLEDWTATLTEAYGLDLDVDIADLLDVAKVAAHNVARPAAPVTTFLVGYAAATRGGGPEQVRRAGELARALALGQTPPEDRAPPPAG